MPPDEPTWERAKRFCWHRWRWEGPKWRDTYTQLVSSFQTKRCVKCGKEKVVSR